MMHDDSIWMRADLVNEDANHVTFRTFQGAECSPEEEEDVVFLSLHTDTQEYASVCVKIKPEVVGKEVSKALGVEADICAADGIVLADERAIAYADHQP
jgi:hypothetical protein